MMTPVPGPIWGEWISSPPLRTYPPKFIGGIWISTLPPLWRKTDVPEPMGPPMESESILSSPPLTSYVPPEYMPT